MIEHGLNLPAMSSGVFFPTEATPMIKQYRGRSFIITPQTALRPPSFVEPNFLLIQNRMIEMISKVCNRVSSKIYKDLSFFTGFVAWRLWWKSSQSTITTVLPYVLISIFTKPCNVHALK